MKKKPFELTCRNGVPKIELFSRSRRKRLEVAAHQPQLAGFLGHRQQLFHGQRGQVGRSGPRVEVGHDLHALLSLVHGTRDQLVLGLEHEGRVVHGGQRGHHLESELVSGPISLKITIFRFRPGFPSL